MIFYDNKDNGCRHRRETEKKRVISSWHVEKIKKNYFTRTNRYAPGNVEVRIFIIIIYGVTITILLSILYNIYI